MSSLGSHEKQLLLEVARQAVTAAAERREFPGDLPQESVLNECVGAFVTLRSRGRLRGCIGQLASEQSLVQVVAHCAKGAALDDPRFKPVGPEEIAEIEIELSVLSAPEDIAPERIEAGKHGLMVSRGWQRGVLLPQVATELRWDSGRFLEEACAKAGLEIDAWKDPGTRIQAFTAEVFSESEFGPRRRPQNRLGYSIST
ncbi:MAG TPA: AmmeMemoRadiSam system protein A [Candidatus Acidoferrales bacterium]|nr:AmmeMemoRadiSam system protein A [Candidatus Acidoferrales bacterium]